MLNHLLDDVLSKRKYFISEMLLAKQLLLKDYLLRGGPRSACKILDGVLCDKT